VYVGAVILIGAAVVGFSAKDLVPGGIGPLVLTLMVLTVATGLAPLTIPKMPISFSISDTFSIVAALLAGPAAGALTAALDGLVITTRNAQDAARAYRIMFNVPRRRLRSGARPRSSSSRPVDTRSIRGSSVRCGCCS
jgi:hypothetical protein